MSIKDEVLPQKKKFDSFVTFDTKYANLSLNQSHKCPNLSSSVHFQSKSNNYRKICNYKYTLQSHNFYHTVKKVTVSKVFKKTWGNKFFLMPKENTSFNFEKNSYWTAAAIKLSDSDTAFDKNYQEKTSSNKWNKPFLKDFCLKTPKRLSQFDQSETKEEQKKRWERNGDSDGNRRSTLSLHIAAYENAAEASDNDKEFLKRLKESKITKGRTFKDIKLSLSSQIQDDKFEYPRQMENQTSEPEIMQFTTTQKLFNPQHVAAVKSEDEEEDKTGPLLATIFGVFGGILIIGLLSLGGFFLYRRYRRRRAAAAAAEVEGDQELQLALPAASSSAVAGTSGGAKPLPFDNSDESPPKDPADVEKSVSIPKTMKSAAKSVNVVHIDHTDVMVPAELRKEETKSLLKSMKKTQKIQAVPESEIPTTISKVLTYCTDDDITLGDRSARETFDDLSGSGKPSEFEALLMRLISHGPRQYNFKFDELKKLLETAAKIFEEESSLLECPVPCTVYGDIHGQYSDLHRWFNLNGWPHQTRSVFLGDFVDRGSHGVEVVALLSCLKIVYPDKIFIVRGNHEEESLNRAYSFYEEVICRFSSDSSKQGKDGFAMYENFKNLFMQLPLAVLIGGRVLGMHGGLSPKMETLQAIRDIKRPIDDFEVGSLECDLVWSDPDTGADTGFRPNLDREPNNGIGQLFAADTVKETCDRLNVDLIIRGHQAPLHGYALFADGRMMTLFSAPGYKGTSSADVNMGACIEFDKEMKITIKQIKVSERFRQNRVNDVEKMRVQRKELRKRIAAISKGNEKKTG